MPLFQFVPAGLCFLGMYSSDWIHEVEPAGEQQLGGCLRYGYGDRSADSQPSHRCAPLFLSEHISWWWGGEYSDVASVYEVTSSIGSVLNSISDQYLFLGKWARHWFIVLDFYCRLKRHYSEYIQTKDHLNELCSIYKKKPFKTNQSKIFSTTITLRTKETHLLWRRANARNVSFETLYGSQFTLPTQLIKPNYLVIALDRSQKLCVSLQGEKFDFLFMFRYCERRCKTLITEPISQHENGIS